MGYEEFYEEFDVAGIYKTAKVIMDESFNVLSCYIPGEAPEDIQEYTKKIMESASDIVRTIAVTVADRELLG